MSFPQPGSEYPIAGRMVLDAVKKLLDATESITDNPSPDAVLSVIGAVANVNDDYDWTPVMRYQAIAILGGTIRWASVETGRSVEEILRELVSNFTDGQKSSD